MVSRLSCQSILLRNACALALPFPLPFSASVFFALEIKILFFCCLILGTKTGEESPESSERTGEVTSAGQRLFGEEASHSHTSRYAGSDKSPGHSSSPESSRADQQ